MNIDPMTSYKTPQLVATYEELYHIPSAEQITEYYGDMGFHVFKFGTPQTAIWSAYEKALDAMQMDSDTFQQSEDFIYRGGIIARMWNCMLRGDTCLRDVLDSMDGSMVLVHKDAPDRSIPLEALLTASGRADHTALLNAWVREVRAGDCAMEVVISGVEPEELERFCHDYCAFADTEQAMRMQ